MRGLHIILLSVKIFWPKTALWLGNRRGPGLGCGGPLRGAHARSEHVLAVSGLWGSRGGREGLTEGLMPSSEHLLAVSAGPLAGASLGVGDSSTSFA